MLVFTLKCGPGCTVLLSFSTKKQYKQSLAQLCYAQLRCAKQSICSLRSQLEVEYKTVLATGPLRGPWANTLSWWARAQTLLSYLTTDKWFGNGLKILDLLHGALMMGWATNELVI